MKTKILLALALFVGTLSYSQGKEKASPERILTGKINDVNVTIHYHSPRVKGRAIFGNLVPYEKVWRAGANENTTIEFDRDVKVEGKKLPAGKYGFFIIPRAKNRWVCVFSNKNDAWGSSSYNEADDALRVKTKAHDTGSIVENLGYVISNRGIFFTWANEMLEMNIK